MPSNPRRIGLATLAAIATILTLCVAVVALVPAFGAWLFPHLSVTSTVSPSPTTNIAIQTPQQVPTSTSISLANISPSSTPTLVVPPNGILFQDNFNNGISPEWQGLNEHWMTGNGALTLVATDDIQRRYIWLNVGNDSWHDYRIEFDIVDLGYGAIIVGVRNRSVFFSVDDAFWACWTKEVLESAYYHPESCLETPHQAIAWSSSAGLELDVSGNEYVSSFDGKEFQRMTLTGLGNGGVSLGVYCDGNCPHIDNFKVTFLP